MKKELSGKLIGKSKQVEKTILLAEDHDALRQLMLDCFNEYFPEYDIETFRDGISLVERLGQDIGMVCVVVTDQSMPGAKGLEIIEEHTSKLNIPFILYSGYGHLERRAMEMGAYAYVQKPDMEGLIKVMHDILN